MKKFNLKVVSPERVLLEKEVTEVILPSDLGEIAILANHEPIVSKLHAGEMIIKEGEKSKHAAVCGGFVHVHSNGDVIVLADSAEHVDEIDVKAAEEAVQKAEEALKRARDSRERFATEEGEMIKSLSGEESRILAETQAELMRNLTRLRVARKHRSKRGTKLDS